MKHLGNILNISGKEIEPVDCITFGSPCQDLSIAGKRAGLAGERSGLFMEAVRIIKEMREKSGGLYPAFAIWGNVPGAFSNNRGQDFRAVLEELARIKEPEVSIPRPENGKWAKAGFIAGNGWSIAWRTLDAQFWGVPQRRRRIAVVVDFAGKCAGEVLFERTGVSGNFEQSIPPWKGIARNPSCCSSGYDRVVEEPVTYPGVGITSKQNASNPKQGCPCHTLNTDERNYVCLPINTQIATRHISLGERTGMGWGEDGDPAYTLQEGHEHAVCCAAFTAGQGEKANGIGYAHEQAPTLRTSGGLSAMPTVLCRAQANTNAETYVEKCPTITTCHDGPPIDFESHSQDARYTQQKNTSPACTAQWGTGGNNMPIVADKKGFSCSGFGKYDESIGTLRASGGDNGGGSENIIAEKKLNWIVRRLTPVECERLQGFQDGWTDIGEWVDTKGKRHKGADSPRYKALGNSIALPQWWWIACKMEKYLPEHATLGSLFDGIGGFPLVWETKYGKGTALWASEIEEFPIAVTKKHFSED